jgi:glycerol dehydrogenase-like iron-containing ADH family enzyme
MKVFEWFEANPGSFDRQHLLMAAYALRDYSLNSKPPVGGEHDLWDTLVSMKLTADTRATHGQVVAMGSLIQLHLQAQQSGDFDMFNRMRDLYSNMRAPVTAQGLGQVDMTKELLIKAIEHQSQQPTNRPSLIHDRFSQIKDPAARRQAIEQMLDAVFFQPR